jgi:hypothetical protein
MLADHSGYTYNNSDALALREYTRASEQGNVDALRVIGDYAYYGRLNGVSDYVSAARYYQQAADLKNAQSMFNLGWLHQWGIGVSSDYPLAKRWYDASYDTDPDAFVPVRLALTSLWLQQEWQSFISWWYNLDTNGNGNADDTTTPASIASMNNNDNTGTGNDGDGNVNSNNNGGRRSSSSSSSSTPTTTTNNSGIWAYLTSWEDILLMVLCAILAFAIYIRSG